jgi:ACS family pantothenate transporter-like MFS transporter
MALWMKWTGNYTVPQINYYPLGTTTITVVSTCIFALWTDYTKSRWWVNIVMGFCSAVSCIMLLVPSLSIAGKFFAWYLAGMGFIGQAVNFSWANEICRDDDQLRSLTLYGMAQGSNIMIAWWNIAFFSVNDLPNFTKGYAASLAVCILSPPIAYLIHKKCQKLGLYRSAPVETNAQIVIESGHDEENAVAQEEKAGGDKESKKPSSAVL